MLQFAQLNRTLEIRIQNTKNIGIELFKTIEKEKADTAAKQEADRVELQRQIEEIKQQVEAKKQNPIAQAVIPQAQASGSCGDWMNQAGIVDHQNASILIMRESGCNPNAVNRSSGACGIPQALPCSKLGTKDPVEQLKWMQNYVFSRYGSWANAVAHSNQRGWY